MNPEDGLKAAVIDALTANIAVIGPDGVIVATNRAWNQFAAENGAPGESGNYLGCNYLEVCDKAAQRGDDGAALAADGIRSVGLGQRASFVLEYRCDAPDEDRWFLMRATAVKDCGGCVVVAHEDITQQRRAEDELRQSKEFLESLVGNANAMIVALDLKGRLIFLNRAAEETTGYRQAELEGQDWFRALLPGEADEEIWTDFLENADNGEPHAFEMEIQTKQGTKKSVAWQNSPLRQSGERVGYLCFGIDVTERRRAEEDIKTYSERLEEMVAERTRALEKAQEELVRKDRLAMLGQFAGSLGHELRNPLGVISNATYFLQSVIPNPEESVKEYLGMIAREVRTSEKIIADLLEISRNRPAEKRRVTLAELINEAMLHQSIPERVVVRQDIPDALPGVFVDSRQTAQVIDNLIDNAVQAMPEGGLLSLTARKEGGYVTLSVSDTGTGIAPEMVDRIFDPLVTTKPRGIGLGLTLSKRLAELNKIQLELKSEIGKGSCFTLFFPADE